MYIREPKYKLTLSTRDKQNDPWERAQEEGENAFGHMENGGKWLKDKQASFILENVLMGPMGIGSN